MSKDKKLPAGTFGRALVDIPAHGLKSGDYAEIPADAAEALVAAGDFDAGAPAPAADHQEPTT